MFMALLGILIKILIGLFLLFVVYFSVCVYGCVCMRACTCVRTYARGPDCYLLLSPFCIFETVPFTDPELSWFV